MQCLICDRELVCNWTDTHGIGACIHCGLPYRLIHYEKGEDNQERRVDREPECIIRAESMPLARAYWAERQRRVFPAICDMGILPRRERSYSGATSEDIGAWTAWCDAHPELLPPAADESA